MKMAVNEPRELLLSDIRGPNIPKDFAESFGSNEDWGVSNEDWDILLQGPEHEHYWEAWDTILADAKYQGNQEQYSGCRLYQDGDLFLVDQDFDPDAF